MEVLKKSPVSKKGRFGEELGKTQKGAKCAIESKEENSDRRNREQERIRIPGKGTSGKLRSGGVSAV